MFYVFSSKVKGLYENITGVVLTCSGMAQPARAEPDDELELQGCLWMLSESLESASGMLYLYGIRVHKLRPTYPRKDIKDYRSNCVA